MEKLILSEHVYRFVEGVVRWAVPKTQGQADMLYHFALGGERDARVAVGGVMGPDVCDELGGVGENCLFCTTQCAWA